MTNQAISVEEEKKSPIISPDLESERSSQPHPQDSLGTLAVFPKLSNPGTRFDRQDSSIITTGQQVF